MVAEAELRTGALALEQFAGGVEVVIVVGELTDVHQAGHLRFVQFHEQAERGDAGDHAVEFAADVLFHPRTLEALIDIALGFLGTPLALRTMDRHGRHFGGGVAVVGRLAAGQCEANRTMHQQIGITPDR